MGQPGYPAGLGWIVPGAIQPPADMVTSAQLSWPIDASPSSSLSDVLHEHPVAVEGNPPEAALEEGAPPVDAQRHALPIIPGRPSGGDPDAGRGEALHQAMISGEGGFSALSSDRTVFPASEGKASDPDPSLASTTALVRASDPSARIASDSMPVLSLPRPLHHPEWAGDVGERVLWMRQADVKSAHLRLDPPHLGEIEVRITLHDDGAEVWFSTPSTPAREALETALPRLRDLFAQHGLQLGQAGVSAEGGGGKSPAFARSGHPSALSRSVAGLATPSDFLDLPRHGGLFEAYA